VKYADVWQSTSLGPDEFRPRAEWIRTHAGNRHIEVGARTTLTGDPDAVLARVKEFESAGAEHVCAYFGKRPEDFVPGMRAFAREVMPALR
jgi:alkanesulfonate monooxygenase SsuD/methylene tetrahydromethanopterin reductase-like flavin-dependent oxidoreductase (luciferase family)